uniref:NADH-ubiquinone oxidoreductase chain 5 n=1 Tax=Eupelmus anpingensis TaxID=2989843 RepID=A0A9E8AA48_9HYME|nr:NADH dehydrogenase subunit 5 [Eupelmus anpingensis]UYR45770.1 NADH dehydrogenase subunit 5 [Eupelmus anpingensis]
MLYFYLSGIYLLLISILMLIFSVWMLLLKNSYMIEWIFLNYESVDLKFLIFFDWVSMLFIFMVMLISSMIMFYCSEYMSHDNYKNRFYYLMLLFIISMILVVISPNLMSILLGWDGLGLISYALVIYYHNYSSFNSGMLTILMNRVGDVMIIVSLGIMWSVGSFNFMNFNKISLFILFFIVVACFTKSAQFPFSSWLPAAMAAPTPVSSLVHSSTLVTVGIYLMIRFKELIILSDLLLEYIKFTGLLTMMMAGLFACYEYDFKKIIAYSTLSQLGLMMLIYSMKLSDLSYFHLIMHAMFKSLMFMSSGVFIHLYNMNQDIRVMGNSMKLFPFTVSMFMIANFSLCATPFFSGFYSKDKILEFMFMMNLSLLVYLILMISTILTMIYSFRLMYYLLVKKFYFLPYLKLMDSKFMNYPMILLNILSLLFGWLMNWIIYSNIDLIFLSTYQKVFTLLMFLLGLMISFLYVKIWNYYLNYYLYKNFLGKMSYILIYSNLLVEMFLMISNKLYLFNDKGWSEYLIKNSLIIKINMLSNFFSKFMMNYLVYLFILFSLYMFFFLCI